MRQTLVTIAALVCLLASAGLLAGCQSEACSRVSTCCQMIQDREGVGHACDQGMVRRANDPETCKSVLTAIRAMVEDEEKELPDACRMEESSKTE